VKTALPNWICAVCLVIIALWVIEKRIQEARIGRAFMDSMESIERSVREMPGDGGSYTPQPSKHSSEWSN
jgi:hypothetical protein